MRDRFNTAVIGTKLTYSGYLNMHLEEPIILHNCLEKNLYEHWFEHYHSLIRRVNGDPPTYHIRERFQELKVLIANALINTGFLLQGEEIRGCIDEDELNKAIIKQYTDESDLYKTVNNVLRDCHSFHDFEATTEDNRFDEPLAPWILQLNAGIRKLSHFDGKAYRGTLLTDQDIAQYKIGEMFIWAPFISASKDIRKCFGGNVIFEITNQEHFMGLNDKGYPRDIAELSFFPEEDEVLYPVSCAFVVNAVEKYADYTLISIKTLDSY